MLRLSSEIKCTYNAAAAHRSPFITSRAYVCAANILGNTFSRIPETLERDENNSDIKPRVDGENLSDIS